MLVAIISVQSYKYYLSGFRIFMCCSFFFFFFCFYKGTEEMIQNQKCWGYMYLTHILMKHISENVHWWLRVKIRYICSAQPSERSLHGEKRFLQQADKET